MANNKVLYGKFSALAVSFFFFLLFSHSLRENWLTCSFGRPSAMASGNGGQNERIETTLMPSNQTNTSSSAFTGHKQNGECQIRRSISPSCEHERQGRARHSTKNARREEKKNRWKLSFVFETNLFFPFSAFTLVSRLFLSHVVVSHVWLLLYRTADIRLFFSMRNSVECARARLFFLAAKKFEMKWQHLPNEVVVSVRTIIVAAK